MDVEKFLQARIAERKQANLEIILIDSHGNRQTLYPKDAATKARRVKGYQRKGYQVCAS